MPFAGRSYKLQKRAARVDMCCSFDPTWTLTAHVAYMPSSPPEVLGCGAAASGHRRCWRQGVAAQPGAWLAMGSWDRVGADRGQRRLGCCCRHLLQPACICSTLVRSCAWLCGLLCDACHHKRVVSQSHELWSGPEWAPGSLVGGTPGCLAQASSRHAWKADKRRNPARCGGDCVSMSMLPARSKAAAAAAF